MQQSLRGDPAKGGSDRGAITARLSWFYLGRAALWVAFLGLAVAPARATGPIHLQFSALPAIMDSSTFNVQLTALDTNGVVQTNFNQALTLTATSLAGTLPLAITNTGAFAQGQRWVYLQQVLVPGYGVRLGCLEYPGQSDAFTVIPPLFYSSSQPVTDIAWLPASHTLLASVPASGGTYSNCLVAIDPLSGLVTNAYPVGPDPAQLEVAPDGSYLYVALASQTMLQRFDLVTRLASPPFNLGTNRNPFRFAYDFCVPSGLADSVVVAARSQDNLGNTTIDGLYRYDSGVPVPLPALTATGGWLVESLETGSAIALSPSLATGNAALGTVLATSANFGGTAVRYRGGLLYDDRGTVYSSTNLSAVGVYPGVLDQSYYRAIPEVDPVFRRAYYIGGNLTFGSAPFALKMYDRDLYQLLFQWTLPGAGGAPARLVRCDTNCLAYVQGNLLGFIHPEATQPPRPPADLALAVSAPAPAPVAGSNYVFSLILSNAGPGTASVVQVTNALPATAVVIQSQPSSGTVRLTPSAFVWSVSGLAAGSNATLQMTVQFNAGGWQTNLAWALGFEADPVFTNNLVALPLFVQLPQQGFTTFPVNYAVQDMLYDPVRDRFVLSLTNGPGLTQTNGLALFNPYTGLTEAFVPLSPAPGQLARSGDGQFLYVSLPDTGMVQQFSLPTLAATYQFAVGGESIYGVQYTNYARNLVVVPGQPNAVVAWAVRHAYAGSLEYGYGLGLYQHGVLAPNVTDLGGSWEPVFDTDSGTLFGYNAGDLRRCSLDASGITFVQQFPTLYGAGTDLQYGGGGHLFNNGGEMLEDNPFQVDWLFAGSQTTAAIVPDPASHRVFCLAQNNGWQLRAYDLPTRNWLGSLMISNVVGTPGKLLRWGADGLAFSTTGGQLFIIRTPLVRTDTFADLALTLTAPAGPLSSGSPATFSLTVANQGTISAANVLITNTLSAGATLLAVSSGAGTWITNATGQTLVWSLPALSAGSTATLTGTLQPSQPGLLTLLAAATTSTFDVALSNNTAVATALVGPAASLDNATLYALPANDLAWSPALGRFLVTANASVPNWAGGLLTLDPLAQTVQFAAALGSDAGRVGLSRDGTTLCARTDFGVSTVVLPALTVTSRFLLNPTSPGVSAYDLKVAPGSNAVVAVGIKTTANNNTWVAAFNQGAQLAAEPNFNSTALSLEFGDQPSPLYVYNGSAFNRYTVDTNGLTLLDSNTGLLPASTPLNLVWNNGSLYSSAGPVINPLTDTLRGTIAGIPAGSQVACDAGSGRVFLLSPGGVLRAYDGPTLLPAGSRTIPGLLGTITRFLRWDVDGFAALTSSNQLAVFHSSLIPTNPPADLSVSLALSPPPYFAQSNLTAVLLVSNAGPNTATSLTWSNTLPAGAVLAGASTSAGSLATNATSVTGAIPLLAAGATASVTLAFALPAAGLAFDQMTINASSTDPNFANNQATAMVWIQPASQNSGLVALTLPVKDLASDPLRPVLYASLGTNAGALANSVLVLDPIHGTVSPPVAVGSNPGRLAVSADGQYLYAALDGAGVVQKLALPGLTPVSAIPVPGSQTVVRLAVCPTNSDLLAIRRSPAGKTSLHLAGVELPNELSTQDLFAFVDTTGQLFGCDGVHSNVKLYQLNTSSNGLSLLTAQPGKQASATDLQSSGGRLFFNGGMVVNPATTRGVDLLPVPSNSLVAPDAGCGRVFFVTPITGGWTLRAFDIGQGIEVGSLPLATFTNTPQKLLRWGPDGLAAFNTNAQVVILRGLLVPTNPPVEVLLSQSLNTLSATTNDPLTVTLQLTNAGPGPVSAVVVTQKFSLALTNVSLGTAAGTATYSNRLVTWLAGSLAAGATAQLTVTGRATQPGTLAVTALASGNFNDVFWGNNAALNAVTIYTTNPVAPLVLPLYTRQLLYDATRDLIYASTPGSNSLTGNLIAAFNPATGALVGALAAGSEPDQMSLPADGAFLYVALDGAMGVQRFNLATGTGDLAFGFSTNDIYYAQDLLVQPGQPNTVVASLSSYNMAAGYPSTVLAYDGGLARPTSGGPARGLAFSLDGSTVFGQVSPGSSYGVEVMTLGPPGFTTVSLPGFTAVPVGLQWVQGRLYSANGQVLDAATGTLLGNFGVAGPPAIDSSAGRAFFLTQSGTNWQIQAFDLGTFQATGTQAVLNVTGTPASLLRCGQDRLAFRTSAGQLFILHSPLTVANATNPPARGFGLSYAAPAGGPSWVLAAATQPGYWYTVYTSTNLVNWTVLTNFFATQASTPVSDPATNSVPARFYRLAAP